MILKRLSLLLVLAFAVSAEAQSTNWIPVGGYWNSYRLSAPATVRFGYPGAKGGNWLTIDEPANQTFNGNPDGVGTLTNTDETNFEVDVLQGLPVVVTEFNVWRGGASGCYSTLTTDIPATGSATTSQTDCPGDTTPAPVDTPPVVTTPAPPSAPPVVTPPATVITPVGPITFSLPGLTSLGLNCASGVATATAADGTPATEVFYIVCKQPPLPLSQ